MINSLSRSLYTKVTLLVLLASWANCKIVLAEDQQSPDQKANRLQYGTLELEAEKKQVDPYSVSQERALKLFENTLAQVKSAQNSGAVTSIPESNDVGVSNYLAASYLFCSVKLGTCRFFLDGLLELEVINSRVSKKASCPTLEGMWRAWIGANMEERQNYQLKTSLINQTSEFRNKERPRYIKCAATVASEIEGPSDDKIFFSKRYAEDNSPIASLEKSITFLKELVERERKEKKDTGNFTTVFAAVGIKQGEPAKDSERQKGK